MDAIGAGRQAVEVGRGAGVQRRDYGRFRGARWDQLARLKFRHLVEGDNASKLRRCPIVVRSNETAATIVQLQCRIAQHSGQIELPQGRTQGPNNHPLRFAALHNKPADRDVAARADKRPGRDIGQRYRRQHRVIQRRYFIDTISQTRADLKTE